MVNGSTITTAKGIHFLLEFLVAQLEVFCTRQFILQFLTNTIDDVFHFEGKTSHCTKIHASQTLTRSIKSFGYILAHISYK